MRTVLAALVGRVALRWLTSSYALSMRVADAQCAICCVADQVVAQRRRALIFAKGRGIIIDLVGDNAVVFPIRPIFDQCR
jgi:hypothetical protein